MKREHLFIIGAMKSGTSSLFKYLGQHPKIIPSKPKETDFFLEPRNKSELDEYYNFWWNPSEINDYIFMEGSVNYSCYSTLGDAANNIKNFTEMENIKPKFIYIVREPIERIKSHKKHKLIWNIKDYNITKFGIDYWLIETSKYYSQIKNFIEEFGEDKIIIIKSRDLLLRTDEVLNNICNFLSIPSIEFETNKNYNVTMKRLLKKRNKLFKYFVDSKKLESLINKIFSNNFINRINKKVKQLMERKINNSFNEQQIRFIKDELKSDMIKFKKEFGIDYTFK